MITYLHTTSFGTYHRFVVGRDLQCYSPLDPKHPMNNMILHNTKEAREATVRTSISKRQLVLHAAK